MERNDGFSTRGELLRRTAVGGAALLLLGSRTAEDAGAARDGDALGKTVHRFYSRPDLRPPILDVVHRAGDTAGGLLFLAPNAGPGQSGPLIMDDTGNPIWFHPTSPVTAMNFRPSRLDGKPVLTWWEGTSVKGFGVGEYVIADASYRELTRLRAGNHRGEDQHEFLLTPQGTALITSYERRTMSLVPLGGRANAAVVGGVVQELEIPSGRVLFEWRSLDHVGVAESLRAVQVPYDYFHINSIDVAPDGDLLVSARNTWAAYKISRKDGRVVWRLGGKRSDFRMGSGATFAWQHDARFHDDGHLVSIFDNAVGPGRPDQSRTIVLELDTKRMRARLAREYAHRPALHARAMGNAQRLADGGYLVGWGTEPYVTEYAADGTVRLDLQLPPGGESYRAFRFPWRGQPVEHPRLHARVRDRFTLYATWNGATDVTAWQLRTGDALDALRDTVPSESSGFETALTVPEGARYADVLALDRSGAVLGHAPAVRI